MPRAREARLAALAREEFDILVIGGGITGCGIARDAALRGVRVALLEQNDFASGTSSRSSRLIHGGLRYLEHGYLHLVFEASAERRRLLRLAPHLVRPLEFLWPVYAGSRVPRWKLGAGLALYDALSLFRNVGAHRRMSAREISTREPALRQQGLVGGARYFDAATDDARLTLANAVGAAEAGAVVANHAAVRELLVRDGVARGARAEDTLTGASFDLRARVVVNAAGPWSDMLRRLEGGTASARATVQGSKGVHVAIPRQRIGNHGALTLLSPRDGRVMFILPSEAQTIIGTTDTYTSASPDDVRASTADVAYLLDSANAFFPDARLAADDVVSAWAGIRPLLPGSAQASGGDPGSASREHAITRSERGVVTITGGKLTTYRVMAAEVVDAAIAELGQAQRAGVRSPTREATLPGGDLAYIDAAVDAAVRMLGDRQLGEHLVRAHGSRWTLVGDEIMGAGGAERVADGLPYTIGEMRYAVRNEMACTLADLLIRRTHVAFQTRDHGRAAALRVANAVEGLGDFASGGAIDAYEREVQRMFAIEPGDDRAVGATVVGGA